MTTAQDIREKTFEKSFSGYNMSQVDEFLDQMAADFSAMAKENAALKGKMRVLVEKVEEYRQTEDSMRLALLSAQKMSSQIEGEAQEKADAILADAKTKADRITRHASEGIANEEAKLEAAKAATQKFFDHMRAVCEKQIENYDKLSQMNFVTGTPDVPRPAAVPAKEQEVEETVKRIETSVAQAALEPEVTITVDTDIPEEEEDPTRLFPADSARKKRSFDDFRFDDDV